MKKYAIFLILISNILLCPFVFSQEIITIATYYPSPVGIYEQLVTRTLGVGDNNADNVINGADAPAVADTGDVWISGRVGLGTTNLLANSRLTISHTGVPLVLRDSDRQITQGGLWRIPLDNGVLRFQANTSAAGDFSTFNSPLVMNQGQVGIGTDPFPTMQGGGLLFLSHPYVSMVLVESDRARDQGGLWSIPLDGGILRFDVNTSAANDFSTHNTPLLMTQGGLIGMGLTDLVGRWNLAQLTINHWGVPLAFNETGAGAAAVNSGGLWHMPLDAGILRFDVNTSAAGDFASFRTTLLMYPDGSIRFPGNNGGAGLYVGSNGSVGIGTLAPAGTSSTASGILTMGFASAQPTATAGATHIFTGADGEGYWMDSAGNTTRQTPHDPETGEWVFFSKNVKTGRIVKVNMEQLVKEVERLSGKKFMSENAPGN